MFRGRYFHTIDSKGRLSIPAKFRDALSNGSSGGLVVAHGEHCLEAYPGEEWERLEAKIRDLPQLNREARNFARLYLSSGVDVSVDSQGRILIPPSSREHAGLVKDVVLVGLIRRFEIWSRDRWEEFLRTNGQELPTLAERLSGLGV